MELIAVLHPSKLYLDSSLKRLASFFDRLALPAWQGYLNKDENRSLVSELEWLEENELVFDPIKLPGATTSDRGRWQERWPLVSAMIESGVEMFSSLRRLGLIANNGTVDNAPEVSAFSDIKEKGLLLKKAHQEGMHFIEALVRDQACFLSSLADMEAYPIVGSNAFSMSVPSTKRSEVFYLVLNAFPVVDESVSWEQILEFKRDPETKRRFLALKNWITDISHSALDLPEIEEKIRFFKQQYQEHLQLHLMKHKKGAIEVLMTVAADALENLAKLKAGAIVRSLFSLRKQELELMESELKFPGRELSYLVKAEEKLAGRKHISK